MIVYRICQTYPPEHNPMDGRGAFLYGGRWNNIGQHALYTASSLALARAELARHIDLSCLPDDYSVYEIEVPDVPYKEIHPLPHGWDHDPPGIVSQQMGDQILKDYTKLGFKVASVCSPNEFNLVLNPLSKLFDEVKVTRSYPFKA
ncbi:RES family NAD+ phosphorylase [Reichenbachiella sp.]|uniref:RES family NAD+ phosphorylase n=1 Tax=Reichenbachiella sp. TaxID=2184521 RepID=UPI003B5B149A